MIRWMVLAVAAGLLWWAGGFLPWLLAGLEFELLPSGAGRLALPLTSTGLATLFSSGLLGGVAAGLLPRVIPARRRPPYAALAVLVGLTAGVIATLTQSWRAASSELAGTYAADDRLLQGLAAVLVLAAAAGVVLGLLGTARRFLVSLPAAVASGLAAGWLSGVIVALGGEPLPALPGGGLLLLVLAVGLVVSTRDARWPALLWPLAILLAWLVPSIVVAAVYVGPQFRPGFNESALGDLVDSGRQVFAESARDFVVVPWWALAGAVVVGLLGLLLPRRKAQPAEPMAPPEPAS